ncbi:hypothetical protein RRG08_061454 [Elysia crispata]|uniref:Uncharacterized protein n=1 Tax=Elysia crispata TaxID=231223 RepID=A0AAE1D4L7_9GAST|nr:hypothetical protein RRG08_061454 [Elysia crispata]
MSKQENNMCTEELKAILSLVESNKKKCKENTIPQQSTYSRCTTDGEPHVYFEKKPKVPRAVDFAAEHLGVTQNLCDTGKSSVFSREFQLTSGENMCLDMSVLPRGSSVSLFLIKGHACINEHRLSNNFKLDLKDDCDQYYVHTWTGCTIKISAGVDKITELVLWIKSSSTPVRLTEYVNKRKVLVVDYTLASAVSLANLKYKTRTDSRSTHLMVDMNSGNSGSPGVVSVYPMSGTIPPHHSMDILPTNKLSYFCKTNKSEIVLKELAGLVKLAEDFVVYIHRSQRNQIESIVTTLGISCVICADELLYYQLAAANSLSSSVEIYKLPAMMPGHTTTTTSDNNVYRHVFLNKFKPYHFHHTEVHTSPLVEMPDSMLPLNTGHDVVLSTLDGIEPNTLYAIVSKKENPVLMLFWGYLWSDYRKRCHSLFSPTFVNGQRLAFVKHMVIVN